MQKFQVIFLQETHFTNQSDLSYLDQVWSGSSFHSFGSNHIRGVSILFRNKVKQENVKIRTDHSGRLINILYDTGNSILQLCNIYAPNKVSDRVEFFDSLSSVIKGGCPTILAGDFNCLEDIYLDKLGGDLDAGLSDIISLQSFLSSHNLIDVFRH